MINQKVTYMLSNVLNNNNAYLNEIFTAACSNDYKTSIAKIPIEVKGKNLPEYKEEGLVITIGSTGETEKDCQEDQERKEAKLYRHAIKRHLHVQRLCVER